MPEEKQIVDSLVQELRRGSLVLIVLSQLTEQQYGYSLVQALEEKGLAMDPGTLYPLLRRLEKQGLLESQWDVKASRPRRYYSLNDKGREVLLAMGEEWNSLNQLMQNLLPNR